MHLKGEKHLKKHIILCALGLCLLAGLSAQTAAELETLLESQAVTYAQAARFVLEAADAAKIADPAEAFVFAAERGWLPKNVSPDAPVRFDGVSLLVMRSFNLKGGLMYSLAKNPHYAYRELVYQNAIQGRTDPQKIVSGSDLIFLTNRILALRESGDS